MIANFIVAFIFPWILTLVLYFKDKRVVLTIVPLQSTLAYSINAVGFHYGYWDLYPFDHKGIVHMPFDIGIYPMLSAWMIYYISKVKYNPYIVVFIFSILTTGIEGIGVLLGRVIYGRGWNVGWTLISYTIPYIINYRYYLCLKSLGVFRAYLENEAR